MNANTQSLQKSHLHEIDKLNLCFLKSQKWRQGPTRVADAAKKDPTTSRSTAHPCGRVQQSVPDQESLGQCRR